MNTLTTWAIALLVAIGLSATPNLDEAPSEIEAAIDTAQAVIDAAAEEQARQQFEHAAQQACGENAYFQLLPDRSVQCFTKRGLRTSKVAL